MEAKFQNSSALASLSENMFAPAGMNMTVAHRPEQYKMCSRARWT